jgi:hypothetical protein
MSSGVHAADLGLISIGCIVSRQNEPAGIVVRGTFEQEPPAQGTELTVPPPAPVSSAPLRKIALNAGT